MAINQIKKNLLNTISQAHDDFYRQLMPQSNRIVAELIHTAQINNCLKQMKDWLLYEAADEILKNHEGTIGYIMVSQAIYELQSQINDLVYDTYESDGADISQLEDQDEFEIRNLLEWARKVTATHN